MSNKNQSYNEIKELMKNSKYSLRKLAKKYNTDFAYIQRVLSGKRNTKHAKALKKEIVAFLETKAIEHWLDLMEKFPQYKATYENNIKKAKGEFSKEEIEEMQKKARQSFGMKE